MAPTTEKRTLEQLSARLPVPRNGKNAKQGKIEDTTTVDSLVDNLVVLLGVIGVV